MPHIQSHAHGSFTALIRAEHLCPSRAQVLWNPIFGIMFFTYVVACELKGVGYIKAKVQHELVSQATPHAFSPRSVPVS